MCFTFCRDNCAKREREDVVKAILIFIFFLFLVGLTVVLLALGFSAKRSEVIYPALYLLSVIVLCIVGFIHCKYYFGLSLNPRKIKDCGNPFTDCNIGLDNAYRPLLCLVLPCMFIAIHNVLWIMLGITTEPFWALPVVTSLVAVAFLIYLLILYCVSSERDWDKVDKFHTVVFVGAVLSIVSVLFSFFLSGSHFFDNSLMSSTIPGILIVILSVWWKFFRGRGYGEIPRAPQNDIIDQQN